MKNFSTLILEPQYSDINSKTERTDEFLITGGLLLAGSLLAFASAPIFQTKSVEMLFGGIGALLGGIGSRIAGKNNKEDKETNKENKETNKEDEETKGEEKKSEVNQDNFNKLLFLAKKCNDSSKENTEKKKNDSLIKLLTACSFDKDGNEIPFEDRLAKMKDIVPEDQFESLKNDMTEQYNKVKDDEKFKKQVKEITKNTKPEDYEKYIKDAKSEAKKSWEEIIKEKNEQEEIDKKIAELEKQQSGDDDDDVQKQINQLKEKKTNLIKGLLPALTTQTSTTPTSTTQTSTTQTSTTPTSGEELDEETKEIRDKIEKDIQEKINKAKTDEEKEEEKKSGEQKLKAFDDAKAEAIEKMKNAKDDKEKQKIMKDWSKNAKKIKSTAYDTDGNTVKSETIPDPHNKGKNIHVKMHIGPRGGKFYWPDGSPHTEPNKVYIDPNESNEIISLNQYLIESIMY